MPLQRTREWVTIHKATPCTLASRRISIAFSGNCQDPDRSIGPWILFPNRASGVAAPRLFRFKPSQLPKLLGSGRTAIQHNSTPPSADTASTRAEWAPNQYKHAFFPSSRAHTRIFQLRTASASKTLAIFSRISFTSSTARPPVPLIPLLASNTEGRAQ